MGMATRELVADEVEPTYYTAAMVRALNDAHDWGWPRYECVYGELLVTPAPRDMHQIVVASVLYALMAYIKRFDLPYVALTSPSDIAWGREDVHVQPDVFVVPRDRIRASVRGEDPLRVRHLLLVTEVVSPSSRRSDRFQKRRLYQNEGVPTYWIADEKAALAEVWTPDAHFPVTERERLTWHPDGAPEPLVISLADLFAEP